MSCHSTIHKGYAGELIAEPSIELKPEECLATADQLRELRGKMALAGIADAELAHTHSLSQRQVYFLEELTQREAWDWLTLVEEIIRRTHL